jgi:hypothetical protein
MWVHHPFREHEVVFQDQTTFALRIQKFPDDDAFYGHDDAVVEGYYRDLEREHAKPGERVIWMTGAEDGPTELPCPECRDKLHWHIDGIA